MLFLKYGVTNKDDEIFIVEDSEYEPEGTIKLMNEKIIYQVLANRKDALKFLISQKMIKVENIQKLNDVF